MSAYGLALARRHDQDLHRVRIAAQHAHARRQAVAPLPYTLRRDLLAKFERDSEASYNAASRALFSTARDLIDNYATHRDGVRHARIVGRDVLEDWSSDARVRMWAKARVGEAGILVKRAADPGYGWIDAEANLRNHCSRWGIEPPPQTGKPGVMRMVCERWWRKRARRMLTERIERRAFEMLAVHRRREVYVSRRNFGRWVDQQQRNAEMLRAQELVSEAGDVVSLAQVVAGSISNPKVRRCELMVRVKGMEKDAQRRGYVGLFLTWTLPSKYHAVLAESGARNPNYKGSTPRESQGVLQALWQRLRAWIKKRGWPYYGLRVAEPHHDGTPHWHMLLFVPKALEADCLDVFRAYALSEDGSEPGAAEHRFTFERIDAGKGSAVAYVAKYISKNTDARGIDADFELPEGSNDGEAGALRARAWASTHLIRQFQFFGAPPVGIWRELRRERETLTADRLTTLHVMPGAAQLELFERARSCADEADYAGHVEAVGGFATPRDALRLRLWKVDADTPNRYGEVAGKVLRGVAMGALELCTRAIKWIIRTKSEASLLLLPRTRVNNCNGQEKITSGGEKPPTPIPPPEDWIPWNSGPLGCY